MRSKEDRERVLNMYFHEGLGYKGIAKTTGIPLDTVKSWCLRYRVANGIPKRGEVALSKEPLSKDTIFVVTPPDPNTSEARIQRLEMEVELLRNFLILAEGR